MTKSFSHFNDNNILPEDLKELLIFKRKILF